MKTNLTIILFFTLSPTANCPCECDVSLKSANKLPNARVSMQLKKWMVRSTGVGSLISLQNRNLRHLTVFRRSDILLSLLRFVSKREGQIQSKFDE